MSTPVIEMMEEDAARNVQAYVRDIGELYLLLEDQFKPLTPRAIVDNIRERCTNDGKLNEELYVKTLDIFKSMSDYSARLMLGTVLAAALGGVQEDDEQE